MPPEWPYFEMQDPETVMWQNFMESGMKRHPSGDRRWKGEATEEEEGLIPLSELSALVKEKLADVIA